MVVLVIRRSASVCDERVKVILNYGSELYYLRYLFISIYRRLPRPMVELVVIQKWF